MKMGWIIALLFIATICVAQHHLNKERNTISEVELLTRTLYHECGHEIREGVQAVATVIYNRKQESYFGWAGVVLKKKQFSCWNPPEATNRLPGNQEVILCRWIARELVMDRFEPIGPWTHYFNPKLCEPSWEKHLTEVRDIGNHRFGVLE